MVDGTKGVVDAMPDLRVLDNGTSLALWNPHTRNCTGKVILAKPGIPGLAR